jgi:outer membrane protein insertion porin family
MVLEPRMSDEGVLTLVIAEGEIEDIRITGNTHTKTYAIRRYLKTQPGEAYNDQKVARDVAKLTSLGWFETVRRDAEVGTEPGKVIVVVTVVEKRRTGMVSVGGGYSSTQGLVGFIDLTKGNLGGNGQAVSIRGEFGGRTSYEFGYRHPWVATPETSLNLGIYDRLILREAFVTGEDDEQLSILYDERRTGGRITFGRPLSARTNVFLGFRSDDVSISGVSEEEEDYLTGAAFEPRQVRSITFAAVNDTRRQLFNPRRGSYRQFKAEFAGLLFGGTEFNKYVLDARQFFPVGQKHSMALRFLLGTTTGEPPYLEQFLVGGGETLRGYPNDRFVGTNMAIANAEYRVPIGENLLAVAFVDVGDAWGRALDDDGDVSDAMHDSFTAHVGYGVGVRVLTPIGPLRLDIGFSEEGTETHFGVRNAF